MGSTLTVFTNFVIMSSLTLPKTKRLGADIGSVFVSCIGQADDTVFVSKCLTKLSGLLQLAVEYCKNYHVVLVPEKTKLLAFYPSGLRSKLDLQRILNPLYLNSHKINFSTFAEHVGVPHSAEGNMLHVRVR